MKTQIHLKSASDGVLGKRHYCPSCKEVIYDTGISQHIIGMAKSELWIREFFNKKKTPHLEMVKRFGKVKYKKILIIDLNF